MSKQATKNPFAGIADEMRAATEAAKPRLEIDQSALAAQAQSRADQMAEKARYEQRRKDIETQRKEFIDLVKTFGQDPRKRWTADDFEQAGEYAMYLLSKRHDKKPTVKEPEVSARIKNQVISVFQKWILSYTEAELPQWRFEGGWHRWARRPRQPRRQPTSLAFVGESMDPNWKPEANGLHVPVPEGAFDPNRAKKGKRKKAAA